MVTRIGGLASGMDIDSMVEKLMQAEKAPLNKLYQKKQTHEWQRDAYRDVNKKLNAFDTFLFDNMTMKKDVYKTTVNSTNSAISATTSAGTQGSVNISKISQLAESANTVAKGIAAGTASTATLESLNLGFTFDANGEAKVDMKVLKSSGKLEDVSLTFKKTDTIADVVKTLNGSATGLNAFYDEQSGQLSMSTQATGAGEKVTVTELEETIGINGPEFNTIEVEKLASIYVGDQGKDFFSKLGFGGGNILADNGKNAILTVNGAEIERQSNTVDINGFNISLNDEYTGAKPITLTAHTDVENMVDKIKKFVENYNGLVESFTASTKEAKYRDYTPLTDEQKEGMSEDEIKSWEEKAKSGILRSDSLVRSGLASMRSTMYEAGGSSNELFNSLYKMGITTSNKTSDNGKLVIDEEKLRKAIDADPDAVFSTFSNVSDEKPGLVQKLRKNISAMTANIEKKAGKAESVNNTFNLGRTLNDVDTRIAAWKTKLANLEERYWKQFGAMESAINKANQQSATLFSGQTQ
ncbi:MAG: flagellar filament capping protein FliD [Solibacillus sp.]